MASKVLKWDVFKKQLNRWQKSREAVRYRIRILELIIKMIVKKLFIIVKIQAITITNCQRVHSIRIPDVLSAKWCFNATRFGDAARKSSPSVWNGAFFQYWRRLALCSAQRLRDAWSSEIFIQQLFSTKHEEMRHYIHCTNQSHTGARKCIPENSGHTNWGRVLRATKNWHQFWSWSLTFIIWERISREANGLETSCGSCESTSHLSQKWQVSIRYR